MTLLTVFVWGITFISTKILLGSMDPVEILFLRFFIAYFALWIIYPKIHRIESLNEEFLFLILGLSGVTLYFLGENIALKYSLASNVGLLVSAAPILTAILAHFFTKDEKFSNNLLLGFFVAFIGIFLVIFNGSFILKLNPFGDFLALLAALMWAVYSIFLKRLGNKYSYIYITRKIFFYGLLTMIPAILFFKPNIDLKKLLAPQLMGNLLFLSFIASSLCYVLWNKAVSIIGAVKASNYIYMIPLITIITSSIVLKEKITVLAIFGTLFIVAGVYISEHGLKLPSFLPHIKEENDIQK
jgi:drug/metabolite transporter (DMT)-like permease